MNFYCDENSWINANILNYGYYYDNFPLQQNSFELPISFEYLKRFYLNDMSARNLTPQDAWLNCYEALFSYLLSRLDGSVTFEGQNWLERTISNLPGAFSQTIEGITNPFGIPIWLWLAGGIVLITAIKK